MKVKLITRIYKYLIPGLMVFLTACSPLVVIMQPTRMAPLPAVQPTEDVIATSTITAASIDIELEQGSGTVCTPDATYFVHASITGDGPATASYEIGSNAGQIAAGYFEDNGGLSSYVTGTVIFDRADTKRINLRFVGPYPYPDDITVFLRVNGGEFHNTKLSCQ